MLQNIRRGEISRIDQKDLAVLQERRNALDQLFMVIRLNVNDHDLRAADLRDVTAQPVDIGRFDLAEFIQGHFSFVFKKELEVIIMHRMRRLDQGHIMSVHGQVGSNRTAGISGTEYCYFHGVLLSARGSQ